MVRTGLIALVLSLSVIAVAGCKGDAKPAAKAKAKPEDKPAPEPRIPDGTVAVTLPKVDAKVARRVQSATAFVTVAKDGTLALGQIAAGPNPYAGRPRGTGPLEEDLYAAPKPAAGSGAAPGSAAVPDPTTQDDPPPPEPDDDDAKRAQGQYKMKKNPDDDDAYLARQQAIEAARSAGVLGTVDPGGGAFASLTGTGDVYGGLSGGYGYAAGPPIKVRGTFEATGPLDVLVLADTAAPGPTVVQVLGGLDRKRTAIAVDGGTAPDAIQFRFGAVAATVEPPTTFEVYVGPYEVIVMSRLGGSSTAVPLSGGTFDRDKLVTALRPSAMTPVTGIVHLTIDATTTVQQLVELLGALAAAGAPEVKLEAPSAIDTATGWGTIGTGNYGTLGGTGTGYGIGGGSDPNGPKVSIGQPNSVGDLDKAIIRRYVKRNIQKIKYCYEKQLLVDDTLEGTVQVQFFIDPTGNVATSTATGVDDEVASCVAGVIKAIEFPKPKGGGGVQVNYPFIFRPTS